MANISKAKEIYKSTPGKINPNKPFVKIRGLYVAGTYRPPYLIKPLLNVVKIGGVNTANVVYYTQTNADDYDFGVISMIKLESTATNVTCQKFSVSSDETCDSGVISMIRLEPTTDNFICEKYTNASEETYDFGVISMIKLDPSTSNFVYTKTAVKKNTQPPGQPILNIKTSSTTVAVIT
jgi:hypothetical protein